MIVPPLDAWSPAKKDFSRTQQPIYAKLVQLIAPHATAKDCVLNANIFITSIVLLSLANLAVKLQIVFLATLKTIARFVCLDIIFPTKSVNKLLKVVGFLTALCAHQPLLVMSAIKNTN